MSAVAAPSMSSLSGNLATLESRWAVILARKSADVQNITYNIIPKSQLQKIKYTFAYTKVRKMTKYFTLHFTILSSFLVYGRQ